MYQSADSQFNLLPLIPINVSFSPSYVNLQIFKSAHLQIN